jgi:hypothetical protein
VYQRGQVYQKNCSYSWDKGSKLGIREGRKMDREDEKRSRAEFLFS